MPRLRRVSGEQVVAILRQSGFHVHAQRGSHVKLRRTTEDGTVQTLTIPRHGELAAGTLRAIIRQASRFIPEEMLRKSFYSE